MRGGLCLVTAIVGAMLAACASHPPPLPSNLEQALAWYDRVIEESQDPAAVERALAEEVFYVFYLGSGEGGTRLPTAYLAAMEGLTLRLQRRNPGSPWLAQAWYHVGEGRRLEGDLDGALAAYENSLAIPCSGAAGVYSLLSLERLETVGKALDALPAGSPVRPTGCPPQRPLLQFPQR